MSCVQESGFFLLLNWYIFLWNEPGAPLTWATPSIPLSVSPDPSRFINKLKEDEGACLTALESGNIFLYHTLAPLLRKTQQGVFQLPLLPFKGMCNAPPSTS